MSVFQPYLSKDTLVHAYGIEGDVSILGDELCSHLEKVLAIRTRGNPDVQIRVFDLFGIDDARRLEAAARVKAFGKDKKLFIMSVNGMTREAQNALLKLFEDPTEHTHFFLLMPSCGVLLPTLRSRLFLITAESGKTEENRAKKFVQSAMKDRFEFLKEIIDAKDKVAALLFLNELEVYLHSTSINRSTVKTDIIRALRAIEQARSYLHDRAPSVKMLLESVALSVPKK